MTKTMEISINNLRNHPNNVRKTYTGIPELAASIKENGILQNLTVVPDPENEDMYLVVIGNRRLQAAKKAGLETVPCVVTDMEESDQALTMLTENMQRKDLTLIEESEGFQMCLEDFGINIGTLAEKTGFSKTTVRHRLNVAKLDRDILSEKMNDTGFQLTITDLALLEKVKSIDKRNEILEEAEDSRDIVWLVEQAALEEKRERAAKKMVSIAKKESISEAPVEVINQQYSYNWVTICSISLDGELPDHLLDETDLEEYSEEIYYIVQPTAFKVVGKRVPKELPQEQTEDANKDSDTANENETTGTDTDDNMASDTDTASAEETPAEPTGPSEYELREQDRRARHKEYDELYRDLYAELDNFCRHLIDKKIDPPEDEARYTANCWCVLRDIGLYVSRKAVAGMMLYKAYYSVADAEADALTDQIDDMPAYTQMLAVICQNFDGCDLMNYNAEYLPGKASLLHDFHDLLDELGFSFSDEAFYEVMTGTHPVYRKDGEESSESDDETFDSNEEESAIDTEIDTDDMDESADISDFEVAEDAEEYSEAA
ncbi:MAG: ParB/RepB/Spo0J family partition protein [Lachnospiraceae bacterium]|nr:ParB/RepB/Spo0J family partition protein [Lachnospiraceae bacterium]